MTTQELKTYLKDVFELEKQMYTYFQVRNAYEKEIDSIDNFDFIFNAENPTIEDEWLERPEYKEIIRSHKSEVNGARLKCLILTIIVIAVVKLIFDASFGWGLVAGFIAIMVVISIWGNNITLVYADDNLKRNLLGYYERCTHELANEIKESMLPRRDHLIDDYNAEVIPNGNASNELLKQVYEKNIIHPKYRNLVAIAQIYEYFDTGRCTELEGPNGAYNLYESELRANIIIDNLSEIASQLQTFNRNMSTLTNSIAETNNLLYSIGLSLQKIEANTALTAYNSQVSATNTELIRRYK